MLTPMQFPENAKSSYLAEVTSYSTTSTQDSYNRTDATDQWRLRLSINRTVTRRMEGAFKCKDFESCDVEAPCRTPRVVECMLICSRACCITSFYVVSRTRVLCELYSPVIAIVYCSLPKVVAELLEECSLISSSMFYLEL